MEKRKFNLEEIEIFLYFAPIKDYIDKLLFLRELLAPNDLQKAKMFYFKRDTNRFIISQGLLLHILANHLQIKPKNIELIYSRYGKPYIRAEQNQRNVQFNLSYSGGIVSYCVTYGTEIGIDIEKIKANKDFMDVIDRFATEDEREFFSEISDTEKLNTFFRWWTRKEAILKCMGKGLSYNIGNFSTHLRMMNENTTVILPDGMRLYLVSLPYMHGFELSIATQPLKTI